MGRDQSKKLVNNLGKFSQPLEKSPATIPSKEIFFSFKYFRQREHFGLSECNSNWFAGLLQRLADISSKGLTEIQTNLKLKEIYRFHSINWEQKNIPIQRKQLNWIPAPILENENEFEIVQLNISTGTGRIIGFWGAKEAKSTFYIVLLDPKHNIQPSQKHNYQVTTTYEASSQYDILANAIQEALKKNCGNTSCPVKKKLKDIEHLDYIQYVRLNLEEEKLFAAILKNHTLGEIIVNGLLALPNNSPDIREKIEKDSDRLISVIDEKASIT